MSNSVAKGETVRRIAEQLGKTVAPTESSTKNGGEFDEEGKMIEKEKEILNSTENAFLEKIRLQRRISMVNKIHTQRERLQTEKSYLNKMLSDLRAHRLELKDKKMLCREPAEKRKLDNNFREIDLEINQTEEELQVVNAQLEKLTLDLDDAREEMDISLETMSGDSEDYFDCQEEGSSQLSNKSSKHNNTESSSERRKPVLQHAKMFEAMARK
uniref:Myosin-11-like n=1 Tax=Saccoglossus kowalevskii TaxID=10224 RepID=A0ABM0MRC3_SACKO|nr:PREDICTED: myosin-11-like [Saccoglossus kowalevskii]